MQALLIALPQAVSAMLTPRRRDALVFLLGLVLVFSPALVTLGFIGGTEYHYESTEVVETDSAIAYADASEVPAGTPISEDVACAGTQVERACALESMLVDAEPRSLGVTSEDPEDDPAVAANPYEFVQVDDEIYRAVYTTSEDGSVGVALNTTSASVALHSASVDPELTDVPGTVVDAAETGEATSRTAVDVPERPVVVGDSYYRVYVTEEALEGTTTPLSLGLFFVAALGLVLLLSLSRKVRVRYVPGG